MAGLWAIWLCLAFPYRIIAVAVAVNKPAVIVALCTDVTVPAFHTRRRSVGRWPARVSLPTEMSSWLWVTYISPEGPSGSS